MLPPLHINYIDIKQAAEKLFLQFIHNLTVIKFNDVFMETSKTQKSNQLTSKIIYTNNAISKPLRINTDIGLNNILNTIGGKKVIYPILIHKKRFTGYPQQMQIITMPNENYLQFSTYNLLDGMLYHRLVNLTTIREKIPYFD